MGSTAWLRTQDHHQLLPNIVFCWFPHTKHFLPLCSPEIYLQHSANAGLGRLASFQSLPITSVTKFSHNSVNSELARVNKIKKNKMKCSCFACDDVIVIRGI